ncbi:hypothetical protein LguiB_019070 [Lonicera macranthoides]
MGSTEAGGESPTLIGGNDEKIFVSVRLRPLNGMEIARNDVSDWECVNDNTVVYNNANLSVTERSMYPTSYTFDRVFGCNCSTEQVYKEGAKEVALSVVGGINSSVFAYGQTSSGKTFTMTGITEYTIADIFDHIHKHKERDFLLKFSAMEIYNESVRDLLIADSTPLRLLDDPERGTIVEKLTEETLRDWNHVIELISMCEAQRQIGETSLNATSSRSHQIIRLTIESSARESFGKDNNSSTLVAAVNFVDLAGSERASQSLSAGTRLKEGCHINRSLLTLGTVIRKLSKGRNEHIPFRDSKLTRILQSSLGGNARTAIICTMSPARSYVEQSRNTLLFASCAKEVNTSAQVNIVMSDKAVIKHLQRELARLENELKSPGSTFIASNCAALLREKDHQLEKLENELKDLTLQRDIAQSQVQDMLRVVRDDRNSLRRVALSHHPNLLARISPESQNPLPEMSILANSRSLNSGSSSSVANYVQHPDFEEHSPHNSQGTSHFSESDSSLSLEEVEEQSNGSSEDLCKDVQCIETEKSSPKGPVESDSNHKYLEENVVISAPIIVEKRKKADQETIPPQPNEDAKLVRSPPLKQDKELFSPPLKEDRELSCIYPSEKPSPESALKEDLFGSRRLSLTKSRSCKASLMISLSSLWVEKIESNDNLYTPPYRSEKDFTGRPQCLHKKHYGLNYGDDVERLPRKGSESPVEIAFDAELEAQSQRSSTVSARTKEMAKLHKQVLDNPVKEIEATGKESLKSVKDVGLDPIEDDYKSISSNWHLEFKGLQREIIELWHACSIPLVHRTYFFLLFKGDPTDSIYMEVELRRLLFLQDTFSQGSHTMQDGRTLTSSSSMNALHRERKMLRKKMQNRLSEQERESLYLKWDIQLSSKNRGLQLAYRLWTDPQNMDHIINSADLVSKLVGFVDPERPPKEMFGLSLANQQTTRLHSLKYRLMSLFQK